MNDSHLLKRRWYQFSLRTMIVSLVVGSAVFGWIAARMHRARENRDRMAPLEYARIEKFLPGGYMLLSSEWVTENDQALVEIEKRGGHVQYKWEVLRDITWLEELFEDPGGPDDPVGVFSVWSVEFNGKIVTNGDLENVTQLITLRRLIVKDTKVTDEGNRSRVGHTRICI